MQHSSFSDLVRNIHLAHEAYAQVLEVGYVLAESATTEIVLCDLTGQVQATLRDVSEQPPGAYAYSYDTGLAQLEPETFLLAFYCNGVKIKTRVFHQAA